MPRPFRLVVNPSAGAGRARRRLQHVEAVFRSRGASFETHLTKGPRDATRIVREALRAQAPGIAVMGGDGTLHEAVNGFFDLDGEPIQTSAWLAPLPCGTGGDFRRTVGLGTDPVAAASQMLSREPASVDVGWISFVDHGGADRSVAFLNIASFGLGGLVDDLVNQSPKWLGGRASFFLGTLRGLARYRKPRVEWSVDDGEPIVDQILNVAVANGQFFGGGMKVAPQAKIDDGLLDVVSIGDLNVVEQARFTPHLYRGTHLGRAKVGHRTGVTVRARSLDGEPVLIDVDGEALGRLPATFWVRPDALRLRA
ncbi:MAG: diacylglycerol kinase family protein [Myxococcota bacterium]